MRLIYDHAIKTERIIVKNKRQSFIRANDDSAERIKHVAPAVNNMAVTLGSFKFFELTSPILPSNRSANHKYVFGASEIARRYRLSTLAYPHLVKEQSKCAFG